MIIPVYNTEKYLRQCLDSCLEQNIGKDEYEIICVDDGSPDGSGKILDEYRDQYPNVKVIHKENGGVSSARNVGLEIACGDYIWFIDSDDFIEKNSIAVIRDELKIGHHRFYAIGAYSYKSPETGLPDTKKECKNVVSEHASWLWAHIFRRDIIMDYSIRFHEDVCFAEDMIFEFELFYHTPDLKVIRIDQNVYYYRENPQGLSHKPSTKLVDSTIRLVSIMSAYRAEGGASRQEAEYFTTIYYYRAISAIFRCSREKRKQYRKQLRKIDKFHPLSETIQRISKEHPDVWKWNYRWAPTRFGYEKLSVLLKMKRLQQIVKK